MFDINKRIMSVFTEKEEIEIENMFQELLHDCTFIRSDEDRNLIRKAFDLSHKAHGFMRRKSGEAYIIHPIAVASIVVNEIGLGTMSVVSALLHDVVKTIRITQLISYAINLVRK